MYMDIEELLKIKDHTFENKVHPLQDSNFESLFDNQDEPLVRERSQTYS